MSTIQFLGIKSNRVVAEKVRKVNFWLTVLGGQGPGSPTVLVLGSQVYHIWGR